MSKTQPVIVNLVGLFIDHENIEISLQDLYQSEVVSYDIQKIIETVKTIGNLAVAKTYIHRASREKLYKYFEYGIESVYTPRYLMEEASRSLADPMMICDIMETIFQKPDVNTYVILTNDKDFIPVIRKLASYGKKVILMCVEGASLSPYIVHECDMHDFVVREVPMFDAREKQK